jgi:dihydrofolate synthase/folylpolyglutamate synthase
MGVPLDLVAPLPVLGVDRLGTRVAHPTLGELRLGLIGDHQAANAAVAMGIVDALARAGVAAASADAIRRGLADARWPGRLELLRVDEVDVLLDGAHNADGARALAAALERLAPELSGGRVTLVLGVLADKDVAGMVEALRAAPSLRGAFVLATPVPDTARALDAAALAAAWGQGAEPTTSADEALARGRMAARRAGGPLVVAGSLYLVGHVRARLTGGAVP